MPLVELDVIEAAGLVFLASHELELSHALAQLRQVA